MLKPSCATQHTLALALVLHTGTERNSRGHDDATVLVSPHPFALLYCCINLAGEAVDASHSVVQDNSSMLLYKMRTMKPSPAQNPPCPHRPSVSLMPPLCTLDV